MGRTVLCIDCNPNLLQTWTTALTGAGYDVLSTGSGKTGLEYFEREEVGIVVLDYRAREIYGGEVALKMRAQRPDVPIIMLCGSYWWPPETALQLVNALVVKADGAQVLVDKVGELLGQKQPPARLMTAPSVIT